MKKIWALLIIYIALPSVAQANVNINEIAWMGVLGTGGSNGEWIELYNSGGDIDIDGWSLFKKQNDVEVKISSLSGQIESGGYFILERSTASFPDPLPQFNNGKLSSGLINLPKGEWLILKNSENEIVDELNFQDGWPAGDNTNKNTMQWSGNSWITAKPTPGEKNTEYSEAQNKDDTKDNPTSQGGKNSTNNKKEITPSMNIDFPNRIYAGVHTLYSGSVILPEKNRKNYFIWNMGDGTLIETKDFVSIKHKYENEGIYTIVVAYIDSKSSEFIIKKQGVVNVVEPKIKLQKMNNNFIQISHTENFPLDISGWNIFIGKNKITIPNFTILAAKGSISINLSKIFNSLDLAESISLQTSEGGILFSEDLNITQTKSYLLENVSSKVVSQNYSHNSNIEDGQEVYLEKDSIFVKDLEIKKPKQNRTKHFIVGAVIVFGIALFLLLERFIAQKE